MCKQETRFHSAFDFVSLNDIILLYTGEYKKHVQTVHISRPKLTASSTGPIAEVTLD